MLASDRIPPKEAPSRIMATGPTYEVYALKYGERDTTKCQFFYR